MLFRSCYGRIGFAGCQPISFLTGSCSFNFVYGTRYIFNHFAFCLLFFFQDFILLSFLSRINIFIAFKNESGTWKAGILRKVLVIGQNTVAYMLIICAFIMVLQVRFLKNTDIGFNRDAVVMVPLPDTFAIKKGALLRDQFEKMPQVTAFTFCS